MKLTFLLLLSFALLGCSSIPKKCDPKKSASVFESKELKVNKISDANDTKKVIFHSYKEPLITKQPTRNRVLVEGMENVSVGGYHIDECTAEETVKYIQNPKPSISYEVKKVENTLIIKTVGEWRYIHHSSALSDIKIRLPERIELEYKHLPLKRG